MDDLLKLVVVRRIENELGRSVTISRIEWERAKFDTINDVYSNMFCSLKDVSVDYFIDTMVKVLSIK